MTCGGRRRAATRVGTVAALVLLVLGALMGPAVAAAVDAGPVSDTVVGVHVGPADVSRRGVVLLFRRRAHLAAHGSTRRHPPVVGVAASASAIAGWSGLASLDRSLPAADLVGGGATRARGPPGSVTSTPPPTGPIARGGARMTLVQHDHEHHDTVHDPLPDDGRQEPRRRPSPGLDLAPDEQASRTGDGLGLRVLGPFEATFDGEPLTIRGDLRIGLLVLLALAAGPVDSADLVGALWDAPPSRATLPTLIGRLRTDLGPAGDLLCTQRGAYRLDVDRHGVDLLAAEQATTGDAETALRSWGGTPLVGLHGSWVSPVRARAALCRVGLLEAAVAADLAAGRIPTRVDDLAAAVTCDPGRERGAALAVARAPAAAPSGGGGPGARRLP